MAYQVLARKWRPQRFDEVVGQEHVTRTLRNAITTRRLAHAFLLCGPRGVGKTTTARILAKCINCEQAADGPVADPCNECATCQEISAGRSLDVLEIDGASNRGIDEIRDLRENVRYAPSAGRSKVYIIDEVHMLTKEAFNALLKTLEEPPDGVYFVFATTEANKVPATIRSRCQKYDFHRIPHEMIARTLGELAGKEGLEVEPAALSELARQADGGLRDAQSLLDQAAAVGDGKVTLEGLRGLLGEAEDETYLRILESVAQGNAGDAFAVLQDLLDRGMDPGRVTLKLTERLRDVLVVQAAPDSAEQLGVRPDLLESFRRVAAGVSPAKLTALLTLASRASSDLRRSSRPRLTLEVALARMSRLEDAGDLATLAARIEAMQGGAPPPSAPRREPPAPATGRAPAPPARKPAPRSSPPEPQEPPREDMAFEEPPRHEPPREEPPREEPEPPRPVAAAGPVGQLWKKLIERVRARKMMLASFLEHGAPESHEDGTLLIVFDNNYYEGMVGRRENISIINEELAIAAGAPCELRVKMGVVPGKKGSTAPSDQPAPRRGTDLLDRNPGLKRIVEDLGGEVMPEGGY